MPVEVIIAAVVAGVYGFAMWGLGWHYGARSFKDKNKRFLDTMKEVNKDRHPQTQWSRGRADGISEMLTALDQWLNQFKVDDDGTP